MSVCGKSGTGTPAGQCEQHQMSVRREITAVCAYVCGWWVVGSRAGLCNERSKNPPYLGIDEDGGTASTGQVHARPLHRPWGHHKVEAELIGPVD